MHPTVIRAGKSNMFLSPVFTEAFVNATGVPVNYMKAMAVWVQLSAQELAQKHLQRTGSI